MIRELKETELRQSGMLLQTLTYEHLRKEDFECFQHNEMIFEETDV